MNCPKCSSEMSIIKYDYVQIDKCSTCNGIWFDLMEREDLLEMKGSEMIDTPVLQKPVEPEVTWKLKSIVQNVMLKCIFSMIYFRIRLNMSSVVPAEAYSLTRVNLPI